MRRLDDNVYVLTRFFAKNVDKISLRKNLSYKILFTYIILIFNRKN